MSAASSISPANIDPPPPAPPPTVGSVFTVKKSRRSRGSVRRNPNTTAGPVPPPPPQPPPSMEGRRDFGISIKYVRPGRERVAPKIFDPSCDHQTKRKRGRPSTKKESCMSPKAQGGDSQIQVEPCAISPVPASPMSTTSNQTNGHQTIHPVTDHLGAVSSIHLPIGATSLHQSHDNRTVHPVTDHVGLQAPGSIDISLIHQSIGLTTNMKVENNVTLNEDEYRRDDISGGNMEPRRGTNLNLSHGEAAALMVENQPTASTRASNILNLATCYPDIVYPTGESQAARSTGDMNTYNVNPSFKELLQSVDGSQPATSTTDSNIYNVNPSYSETLKSIFQKHGDIAKDCTLQSSNLRTYFLESICKDVQELQSKKLNELDYALLNSYYMVVNDGETMKFNMKWFRERLDEIKTAIDTLVESQKNAEQMEELENKKRDIRLKKIELERLISELETKESLLALETLQVVEDMKRNKKDLECKFKHFLDMHLMDGLL